MQLRLLYSGALLDRCPNSEQMSKSQLLICLAKGVTITSACIVYCATRDCFFDFQCSNIASTNIIKPEVDLQVSRSPPQVSIGIGNDSRCHGSGCRNKVRHRECLPLR